MLITRKKVPVFLLGLASLVVSRAVFMFINDPEGPNLVVVVGLATILFFAALAAYACLRSIPQQTVAKIMKWAAAALLIPLVGNTFVHGWNWTWHDFLFAWVFWVILGLVVVFVRNRVGNRTWKNVLAVGVVLAFAAVWALLATG